jgi:hypothetical protein
LLPFGKEIPSLLRLTEKSGAFIANDTSNAPGKLEEKPLKTLSPSVQLNPDTNTVDSFASAGQATCAFA